jgi:tRNA C32,U32 (ribose-2'-O)-methylase TrmJ
MMLAPGPVLVLVNPQDIVNIASAVRIARNFGIERMRLVQPEVFDPYRIEGIAHNSADFVARIEILPTLEAAIADCVLVAVLTARARTAKRRTLLPRAAAEELTAEGSRGVVAIVAGREDSSLNLAQAIAIMAYETFLARGGESLPLKPHRKQAEPATAGQLEELFGDWRRALWAIDFFKTRRSESVMRSFREILHRAELDGRESALMRAMGIEVVRYLGRVGAPLAGAPPSEPGGNA